MNRDGTALVVVLATMLLLCAIGLALVLLSTTDRLASDNVGRASSALYAADAAIERVLPDLLRAPDWDAVLAGRVTSGLTDGPPGGTRVLADGSTIVLDEIVSLANCGTVAACSDAAMDAVTAERPWGRNNPRWSLFAYGPLTAVVGTGDPWPAGEYVVVLASDDPAESDDDPLRDGEVGSSPGAGVIQLRAEAFGPFRSHRVVEVSVARGVPGDAAAGYAGQRGQGRSAGAESPGVQSPGAALSRLELQPGGGMTR